jgi:hypothetical protein
VACLMIRAPDIGSSKEARTFRTVTRGIEALRDWLKAAGVTHDGMESTGVYWRPIYASAPPSHSGPQGYLVGAVRSHPRVQPGDRLRQPRPFAHAPTRANRSGCSKGPRSRSTPTAPRTTFVARSPSEKSAAEPAATPAATAATPSSASITPAPSSASPSGTTSAHASPSQAARTSPPSPNSSAHPPPGRPNRARKSASGSIVTRR